MAIIHAQFSENEQVFKIRSSAFDASELKDLVTKELAYSVAKEILSISKVSMIPVTRNGITTLELRGHWFNFDEGLVLASKLEELEAYKKVYGADNALVKRHLEEQEIEMLLGK